MTLKTCRDTNTPMGFTVTLIMNHCSFLHTSFHTAKTSGPETETDDASPHVSKRSIEICHHTHHKQKESLDSTHTQKQNHLKSGWKLKVNDFKWGENSWLQHKTSTMTHTSLTLNLLRVSKGVINLQPCTVYNRGVKHKDHWTVKFLDF